MKMPYIINYLEEFPLQPQVPMHYDNLTQMNYIDENKSMKALSFNYGPETTKRTETTENTDNESINFETDITIRKDSVENNDLNYLGSSTTKNPNTVPVIFGPDTTRFTKSNEAVDTDYAVFGPETTKQSATVENSDFEGFFFGPDTTKRTFTVEPGDEMDIREFYGPETTKVTRSVENSDEH